jgi:hypothetical protein
METMVKISAKRLAELLTSENILGALEAAGVDNWEWYGEALNGEDAEETDVTIEDVLAKYETVE